MMTQINRRILAQGTGYDNYMAAHSAVKTSRGADTTINAHLDRVLKIGSGFDNLLAARWVPGADTEAHLRRVSAVGTRADVYVAAYIWPDLWRAINTNTIYQ